MNASAKRRRHEYSAAQAAVTASYDRMARFYDFYDKPMDLLGVRHRRKRLLCQANGTALEVGVGTGRNLGLYPDGVELVGIDVSANMLARARRVAEGLARPIALELGDVQDLPFRNDSFDTAAATCVFCSVADPVVGLRELARVVRPGGQVLLLEHVRPRNPILGWVADRIAPVIARFIGPEINRRTEANVTAAGLDIIEIRCWGVWREIRARPIW
ncbi:MAG: methyltransferase domain-containing protein [Acidimicrobiia bacterium]|nr:methyltransferase domain-containing protein [Acidimicrobiia bacterium]